MSNVDRLTNSSILVTFVHWHSTCFDHVRFDDVHTPKSRS